MANEIELTEEQKAESAAALEKHMSEFVLSEDEDNECNLLVTDEEKDDYRNKIKLEWEKKFADPHAQKVKPENNNPGDSDLKKEEPYKAFETKEKFTKYMEKKTKNLKAENVTLKDENTLLKDEIKELRNKISKSKNSTKILFVENEQKNKTKKGNSPVGMS